MSFVILGLGTAQPPTSVTQAESIGVARSLCCRTEEHATWLPGVYSGAGVARRHLAFDSVLIDDILNGTRHSASMFLPSGAADDLGPTTGQRMRHYAEHAVPLALQAAGQALKRSGLAPGEITHLVTVSCTGFGAPGVDVRLVRGLQLAPTVQRTHVGFMGCHGALNGLRVAKAFTAAEAGARVLLCAVELCGLHYYYGWDAQKMVANALFADGAAAVVGAPEAAAPADGWRLAASGSCLLPDSENAMTWPVGDHGFEMTLSKQVPALIARHLRPWLEAWLDRQGVALAAVGSWAVHPGGPRIVGAVEEALGLPREATAESRQVLAECGNMSSPTLLFILDRLRRRPAPRPCVALGFGPGLNAEVALFC